MSTPLLLIVSIAAAAVTVTAECPDGWTEMGERSCVRALAKQGSFEDSQTACRDLHSDAHLAIPRSAAEQQILLSLTSGNTWIGVQRAEHGKPGFVDVKGEALGWKNWKSGEPNNSGGKEDCAELYIDGLWNDQTCSDDRAAICQITKVSCTDGWVPADSVCVKVSSDKQTFQQARAACAAMAAHLAEPRTPQINAAIQKLVGSQSAWMGGADNLFGGGKEGAFVWLSDFTPVTYADWADKQPNNYRNMQHCMAYYKGKWNDDTCTAKRLFVCQKDSNLNEEENCADLTEQLKSKNKQLSDLQRLYLLLESKIEEQSEIMAKQAANISGLQNIIQELKTKECKEPAVAKACPQPTAGLGNAPCDVTTEGGPWTVIQRRDVGDVLFNKKWEEYQSGFGDETGDFWVGLAAIHELCPKSRPCQVRFEFKYEGKPWDYRVVRQPSGRYAAQYGQFAVAGPDDYYRLTLGEYESNASTAPDDMTRSGHNLNGQQFTTTDADHDAYGGNCALYFGGGGWWYRSCSKANLNNLWGAGDHRGLTWDQVTGKASAKSSRIMVRVAA